MSKPKIAVRVQPLRKWADVGAATQHGQRIRSLEHVDKTRSALNVHYQVCPKSGRLKRSKVPADITACLRRRADALGASWHKGAIVGTEVMFIASPEFFATRQGSIDLALARRWADACIDAWEGLFPGQSVAARLDLDETSPHLSIFFLPLHERHYRSSARPLKNPDGAHLKVSHNKTFGEAKGPEILAMLQSWVAAAMQAAGFDLERGLRVDETGAQHKTPAAGRNAVAAARELAQQIEELAREEAARRHEESELAIQKRLDAVNVQIAEAGQRMRDQHRKTLDAAERLKRSQEELEAERVQLQREREDLLTRIQTLDHVMHIVARELDVEVTGSFWHRLRAIVDALADRRSGGGPAFRPG